MREAKKFNVLKGFTIFFSVVTLLAFIWFWLLDSNLTNEYFANLFKMTVDETTKIADYGLLVGIISGVIQFIFMCCAFGAAKKAIRKGRARTIQSSVYMNDSKEERHMKKEARRASKKDSKMKSKEERLACKQAKVDAKLAKKEAKHAKRAEKKHVETVAEEKKAEVKHENKPNRIEDILNGMK